MSFWLIFLAVNLFCFLPLYLANIRQQANPIAFLTEKRFRNSNRLKLLYTKHGFSDPFHFHVEFALLLSLFLTLGWTDVAGHWLLSLLLTFIQIEIIYTAVLTYIFSRPPVFRGDWPLIKSGWILWKENRHWIVLALVFVIAILLLLNHFWVSLLFAFAPENSTPLWGVSAVLLLPAIYHWRSYDYTAFHYRTMYSTLLHCTRNLLFGRQFNILFEQDADFFDDKNLFKQVQLKDAPDVVHICVESYGAIVFNDPKLRHRIEPLLQKFEQELEELGFHMASSLSTAPIFTGGSWLSYSTFMYGFRFDNLQLYDGLFQYSDNFASYESIFHVLNRNDYHHVLAAPLGGVDDKDVSWDTISRCFQPKTILNWNAYDYQGPKLRFFSQADTFCMPDQYALNFAYDRAKQEAGEQCGTAPVSLFYCTMNSHLPYESPVETAQDWRSLNDSEFQMAITDPAKPMAERYLQAIEYQLQFALSFVKEYQDKDIVVTLFGDHQPPFVATESMGRETPVHVIAKSRILQQSLIEQGFSAGLQLKALSNQESSTIASCSIKHEAWQSLFLGAMNKAYGVDKDLDLPVLQDGVNLFPEQGKSP